MLVGGDRLKNRLFAFLLLVIGGLGLYFSFIILMLRGPDLKTVDYYSNHDNYEKLTGKIEKIDPYQLDTDSRDLYIIIDVNNDSYNGYFRVIPANEKILKENGFYDDIKVGDTITIFSAPGYFGDGYRVPIVGLRTETKEYLDFDVGMLHQVDYSESEKNKFLTLFIPSISISIFSLALSILLFIRYGNHLKK